MLKTTYFWIITSVATGFSSAANWLDFPAKAGTANGKTVVLVSGDEEYRSEESCPMLAKILSERHGFHCVVLFSLSPDQTFIDPNYQKNIPGTEALDKADLMVIGTRFRDLPADQLAPIANFLNAGKPVIGFRTATHAFNGAAKTGDFRWSQFGLQILGETWVSHHGHHKKEGTRSFIETSNSGHEVLQGVKDVFATTDVYGVKHVTPENATILMRGAVTETLDPQSKNLDGPKNSPMMPLAWLREYTAPNGSTKGKAMCTTMGASTDFLDEDLRRLIINGALHLTGQKVPPLADVTFVDPFVPTDYGFQKEGYYKAKNLTPDSFGLGVSVKKKLTAPNASHAPIENPEPATSSRSQAIGEPQVGERIVLIGNGLAERDAYYSLIETELHLRYPEKQLFFRNMGRPGDTPAFRPHPSRKTQWAFPGAEKFHPQHQVHSGEGFFPNPDQWLTHLEADTVVAFFGYNESFDGAEKLDNFKAELEAFVKHTLGSAYNGKEAPRLVLVSPIAYENLKKYQKDLPDGTKENQRLRLYTKAIQDVASANKLTFVDLFTPTFQLYTKNSTPFTSHGFVPTEVGYETIAKLLATGIYGEASRASKTNPQLVRDAVKQKDWLWNNDYNILNGVHTHGRRYNPYGPKNYPDEVRKNREMASLRDNLIHAVAAGKTTNLTVDDSKTHPLPAVQTNYRNAKEGQPIDYKYGDDALKTLTVPEGYKISLFASEKEFPNLANPMQMSFDTKGRLWVAVMPTYPHYRPGDAMPNDKILIYEDTDNDGKADKEIIFADQLHLPIGIEFAAEGVYIAQEPNLVLLRDTNGDDKVDSKEIVMSGFDTHDTHHAISAFCADPSGAFIMGEGVFLHTNAETPYGPERGVNGGFWRFSPQQTKLERTAQLRIPNPWGVAYDDWGQDFFLHTSGPDMNWMMPASIKNPYGATAPLTKSLIPAGQAVRPTSGIEFVSSSHFPDEVQGDVLLCNNIGFLGIKQHSIQDEGTGYKTAFRHNLLQSTDGNFRPVDLEFAPDGSLYVVDWHNVLIGHMQHNARDPLRDHVHGRIYRITYPSRPLVKPASIHQADVATLLENLKAPEYRTRYRTRLALRSRGAAEVMPALLAWASKLDAADPRYEHHLTEALWVTWGLNSVDRNLLEKVMKSKDHRARAAAVRVLRYNAERIPNALTYLENAAKDEHGRVRLEAVVAATWINEQVTKHIVGITDALPQDPWIKPTLDTLKGRISGGKPKEVVENPMPPVPGHLSKTDKKLFRQGHEIYHRDAHCATCHQANGKGLAPAFPPLNNSPWVTGDQDRLIKLTLHGLMGPFELNGQKYDGQVPMTAFGGLLKDHEVAAVLTYVRNQFGNKAPAVLPADVKRVREATKTRNTIYLVDELLKEHPMK
jgi:mono/diheme cytochrome c family protein/glucose/arabinose dehydrogenase